MSPIPGPTFCSSWCGSLATAGVAGLPADVQPRQQRHGLRRAEPAAGQPRLAIRNAVKDGADIGTDRGTHASQTAPDTVEMTLNLAKFGVDKGFMNPALTVSAQLGTPPSDPVTYALQICHG